MKRPASRNEYRLLLNRKLTELSLYAKELCPEAEEDRIEVAIAARAAAIFEPTGL